jgi:hypothetical protein
VPERLVMRSGPLRASVKRAAGFKQQALLPGRQHIANTTVGLKTCA